MLVKTLPVGHLDTNCYIVSNENTLEAVVIDPGAEGNTIMDYLESNRLRCVAVMLTHGHFDHTGAADFVAQETGAPVYMSKKDDSRSNPGDDLLPYALPENGFYYDEGDTVEAAGLHFKILATPGHTAGGVSIICEDALFTGDTLFHGSCGRVDLPTSSLEDELRSIKRLCLLEGDYEVYPGHMDSSTLERERNFNYYCRAAMQQA